MRLKRQIITLIAVHGNGKNWDYKTRHTRHVRKFYQTLAVRMRKTVGKYSKFQ